MPMLPATFRHPARTGHGRRPPAGQLAVATERRTMTLRTRGALMDDATRAMLAATRGNRSLLAAVEFPAGDIPWHGVLMFTDTDTSDFRYFPLESGRMRDLPLPLQANLETPEWGHEGAFNAGRIETFDLVAGACAASGFLNDPTQSDDAFALAYALAVGNIRGVSVDLGVSDADWDPVRWDDDGYPIEWRMVALDWELMGATITPFPAFSGAYVVLDVPGAIQDVPTQISPEVMADPTAELPAPDADAAAVARRPHALAEARRASPVSRARLRERAGIVAAATGSSDLALAAQDSAWDPSAAAGRVLDFATADDGTVDEAAYGAAFFWRDESVDGIDGFRLGFADVNADGSGLLAVPDGVMAAADELNAGIDGMPDTEAETIRGQIDGYCAEMRDAFGDDTIRPPWDGGDGEQDPMMGGDAATPALVAGGARPHAPRPAGFALVSAAGTLTEHATLAETFPLQPDPSWFDDPGLDEPTEPRYLGTGRCYGHLALFDVCHIGYEDACVCAPHSALDYALFHSGYITCADGTTVRIGQLTMDTGHAADYLGHAAAAAHYDNTGTAYADVRVGEDAHGIWFAGAMRRTITDDQIRVAQASALSGDWRGVNGNLELVAALAVNTPGFGVYRSLQAAGLAPVPGLRPHLAIRNGQRISLTASAGAAPLARLVSRRQELASMADMDLVVNELAALRANQERHERILRNLEPMAREAALRRINR